MPSGTSVPSGMGWYVAAGIGWPASGPAPEIGLAGGVICCALLIPMALIDMPSQASSRPSETVAKRQPLTFPRRWLNMSDHPWQELAT